MSCPRYRHRFYSPLRSLSRAASDYSSDSAVCFGILRPLRPLREIKDKSDFVFHAKSAKSAEIFLSVFTLALEGSQTSLRQESAESLSTPSPSGLAPVSGGESVTTENTAQADCPPETGVTRSEATEGVDKSLNSHPLTVKEQFSVYFTFQPCFLWKSSGLVELARNHGS